MITAVIDIGSNSVRLLIANVEGVFLRENSRTLRTTRLYGGLTHGILSEEAILRTASAVEDLAQSARQAGAQHIFAFATSAVRDAKNASVFLQKIFTTSGIAVDVLSGKREAALGYLGAVGDRLGAHGVLDIGGGSVEIIIGRDKQVTHAVSLPLGAVRLAQEYPHLEDAKTHIQKELACVCAPFAQRIPDFIGIGGTITTFAAMAQNMITYDQKQIHGYALSRDEIAGLQDTLKGLTLEQRKTFAGLPPARADIIVHGGQVLLEVLNIFDRTSITVSEGDNLLGYLRSVLPQP